MPFTLLEEFDYRGEMLYPHLAIPSTTLQEQTALARRMRRRPRDEILLLSPTALDRPPIVAGLTEEQIEAVMRLGSLSQKKYLLTAFDTAKQLAQIEAVAAALGREAGESPEETRHRLARTRLYINDHRHTFIPVNP
ncbi:hypothetical protein HYW67_01080 [Candidatus Parcubacteria bacterium]|nr:hypothetical protein [Candidatus Parcubacteria bacterium]